MSMGVKVWHRALPQGDAMRPPTDFANLNGRSAAQRALDLGMLSLGRSSIEDVSDGQPAPAYDGVFPALEEGIFFEDEQLQLDLGNAPDPVVQRWSAPVRLALLLGGVVASWALFLTLARLAG